VGEHNPDGMQVQFSGTLLAGTPAPPVLMPLSVALPLESHMSRLSCVRPAPLKPPINVLATHSLQTDPHSPRNLSIVSADQLIKASLQQDHPASPCLGPLIGGTTYTPTLQNVIVPKRLATGLQLDDLYFNSICATRHSLQKSLYGQYAYSLVRMEVHSHPFQTASAIEWAFHYTAIFWALPLLHALVVNALMLLKGNPFAYTRLPRCAARARQHRYRKACYQYQSQMLIRCFFFYLIMFYMGGDPSSGRRSIYSTSYVNSSNTRFRKRRPPCIECTMLTLTIIYFGCPIFLSLYETFLHDLISGYYGPLRSYASATCQILRLCLYQTGLRALRVNPWHAAASSIYYSAASILVRWQYITMPSMILLAYAPIIIALLLSLSEMWRSIPSRCHLILFNMRLQMPIYLEYLTKAPVNLTMSIS
jgi:hypothetical protein